MSELSAMMHIWLPSRNRFIQQGTNLPVKMAVYPLKNNLIILQIKTIFELIHSNTLVEAKYESFFDPNFSLNG